VNTGIFPLDPVGSERRDPATLLASYTHWLEYAADQSVKQAFRKDTTPLEAIFKEISTKTPPRHRPNPNNFDKNRPFFLTKKLPIMYFIASLILAKYSKKNKAIIAPIFW
jgi:hypothetical protein